MNAELEIELIECLDALAHGESLERILARYPEDAAQLRPLLETAAGLPALRMEPSEAAKLQSRQKFMAQANLLRRTSPRKAMGFLPRFATGFVAVALVAGVLGSGAVAASGSALPGDPLYNLKRTVEDARLNAASSPAQRQELQQEFEQRRIGEANALLDAGRESEVEFSGTIEVMQPKAWIISSLVVQLDANTQIVGTPQIDRGAEVRAVTGPHGLRATSISINSPSETEVTTTPEPTETPQTTETPEPAKSTAPTATPGPQPGATIEPQPKATIKPQPVATIVPQPVKTQEPTETAQPTETPQPVEVEFTGSVNAQDVGTWIIDGTTVVVDNGTEIHGNVGVGQRVKVKAWRYADNRLVATRVDLIHEDGNSGPDTNGNQNSNENQNSNSGNSNDDEHNSNGNQNGNDSHGGNINGNDH